MKFLRVLMVVCCLLVSACATRGPPQLPPVIDDPETLAAAEAQQTIRAAWLHRQPEWAFDGRVAVNTAGKGGSGRIEWRQNGRQYQVSLSAPVTRQSWRLTGDVHSEAGRLEGLEGGVREGESAEDLLREATGWDIPVNALADWVRGLAAAGYPAEPMRFAENMRLRGLEQAGWRIEYPLWFDPEGDRPSLPKRIDATREDGSRVRLIVDRWDFPAP